MSEAVTGGQAVVEVLRTLGVEHVFGIVSVHNLPILDAVARTDGIALVATRHEQGAVHAADGYARATGRLGVAVTSTGPGAANSVGGLFEAAYASSRVLTITGQIDSGYLGKNRGFIHEAPGQIDMLRSVCRRAETVRSRAEISDVVRFVAADVLTGRPQPGAVEIPIDYQYAAAPSVEVAAVAPHRQPPAAAEISRAWAVLSQASRVLIWAGGGVVTADASAELTRLAERLGAPVVTTIEGRGAIAEDHPLCLGPNSDTGPLSPVIDDAEVVLAVGTRFQLSNTMHQSLVIRARLVHLDADRGVIDRVHRSDVAIVADAKLGLEALLKAAGDGPPTVDREFADRAVVARSAVEAESCDAMGPDHERIVKSIRATLPRDANLVKDATIAAYVWANRVLPVYEPRTSIRPTSMAIGPGLPLAVGAARGTDRPTVLIQGDGGLMLSLGELATAVEQDLPLVICVFNDGGYGILRWMQDAMLAGRRTGVDLVTPDFAQLAASFGMAATRVAGADQFEEEFARAVQSGRPALLDIDLHALHPMEIRPQKRP